jgi:hypothetical protein
MTYWNDNKDIAPIVLKNNVSSIMQFKKTGFYIPDPAEKIDKNLLKDVGYFYPVHPECTNASDLAQAFLKKWPGYSHLYSLDQITQAFKIVMK